MLTKAQLWDLLRRAQGVSRLERRLDELQAALEARAQHAEVQAAHERQQLLARVSDLESRLTALHELVGGDLRMVLRAIVSEDAENRRRLWRARAGSDYELPFRESEPLVSIVIPTLDRPEELRNRSLPSVLEQSHQRIEVLVIGDHAGPEVEEAVRAVGDPRVTFHNLSQRLPPQADSQRWWYVASVMARNEGFRLARGSWLMSFDDDDLMYPRAVERLLAHAREHRAEVAYGRFRIITPDGPGEEVGEFPPSIGKFGWQTGIRHHALRFFERELCAADFATPNDIFHAEAMLRAGVRFAMIPEVMCDYYASWYRRVSDV